MAYPVALAEPGVATALQADQTVDPQPAQAGQAGLEEVRVGVGVAGPSRRWDHPATVTGLRCGQSGLG